MLVLFFLLLLLLFISLFGSWFKCRVMLFVSALIWSAFKRCGAHKQCSWLIITYTQFSSIKSNKCSTPLKHLYWSIHTHSLCVRWILFCFFFSLYLSIFSTLFFFVPLFFTSSSFVIGVLLLLLLCCVVLLLLFVAWIVFVMLNFFFFSFWEYFFVFLVWHFVNACVSALKTRGFFVTVL